jgi:uncharacterized coiled-coil protein SlyX
MSHDLEDRLIRIEHKLAHLERLTEKLEQATVDQELRLERIQNRIADRLESRPKPVDPEH